MNKKISTDNDAKKITIIGIAVNIILIIFKFIAGIFGTSKAMIADAFHSTSDLIADVIVLFGLKVSSKPSDEAHHYGHGKVDSLVSLFIGIILIVLSAGLIVNSMNISFKILKEETAFSPRLIALVAALITIISKEILYKYTVIVGKKTKIQSIHAMAWHHRSDAFSSIATLFGIGGAYFLGKNWRILDPIAAIVVSVFIFKIGFDISRESISGLIDTSPRKEKIEKIQKIIRNIPGVINLHDLRIRMMGSRMILDLHIEVDPSISVEDGHGIADEIENILKVNIEDLHLITVHVEPSDKSEDEKKILKNKIIKIISEMPEIKNYHRLNLSSEKDKKLATVDIELSPEISLEQGHEISRILRNRVKNIDGISDIVIHADIYGKEEKD